MPGRKKGERFRRGVREVVAGAFGCHWAMVAHISYWQVLLGPIGSFGFLFLFISSLCIIIIFFE